jgi:hypothetical protein
VVFAQESGLAATTSNLDQQGLHFMESLTVAAPKGLQLFAGSTSGSSMIPLCRPQPGDFSANFGLRGLACLYYLINSLY